MLKQRMKMKMSPEYIKNMRKKCGFNSAEAFADAIGMQSTTIKRWESGKIKPNRSCQIILRLFDKHGASIFYALKDKPKIPKGMEGEKARKTFTALAEEGWFK